VNADRERATKYGNQLIECTVKKAAVEASLHAAQTLLLDIVDALSDDTLDLEGRQLAVENVHRNARHYLMTAAFVLPPDQRLLESLSLSSADEPDGGAGEDPPSGSAGQAY
jgi:hypothetical protein